MSSASQVRLSSQISDRENGPIDYRSTLDECDLQLVKTYQDVKRNLKKITVVYKKTDDVVSEDKLATTKSVVLNLGVSFRSNLLMWL